MKTEIKEILYVGLILLGSLLFDMSNLKLTGVIVVILSILLILDEGKG